MFELKFFSRCRVMRNILWAICSVMAIALCFNIPTDMLNLSYKDVIFFVGVGVTIVLAVVALALHVIVKDAQQDFEIATQLKIEQDKK